MRFLLDLQSLAHLVRYPRGRIAERIRAVGEANVCTSIIAAAELRFAAAKNASPRFTAQVGAILEVLDTLPLDLGCDVTYASLHGQLESAGHELATTDLLVAAHAATLDFTLVTSKEVQLSRIRGLLVENWLR
jgi:tRNA(fMet)-specific endonuclease VapC